jgi:hypothetical protein
VPAPRQLDLCDVLHPFAEVVIHAGLEHGVGIAPDDERGDEDRRIGQRPGALAHGLPVVVDGGAGDARAQKGGPVGLDVRGREDAGPAGRALQGGRDRRGTVASQEHLRHAGRLEEEHVAALQELRRMAREVARIGSRVRGVHRAERAHRRRLAPCRLPGDDAAPIVPDDVGPLLAQRADQRDDIGDERLDAIAAARLVGEVVAAHVRRDGAVARSGERRQLEAPGVPELGEAVQEQHDRPFALLDQVEADAVRLDPAMARMHRRFSGQEVLTPMARPML